MPVSKLVRKGLLRAIIVLIFMGISLYFTAQKGDPEQTRSLLAATFISVSVAGFSVIYDYDIWSVKKKIMVHTLCMLATVYPALINSGWYDTSNASGYWIVLLSFIIFGVVFATIGYLVSKYILKNVPTNDKEH